MFQSRTDISACCLFFLLSLLVFTQGLRIHGLEYRDDEIFYYKATQEMLREGNYLSPTYFGENRFQKPILYYWLVLLSYQIFGANWVGARFVAVIFAGLTVSCTWMIGKILFNRRVATLSALILMTTPLFFRHAKNAVPDMVLNFFIVWSIYWAIRFIQSFEEENAVGQTRYANQNRCSIMFFVSCALGFMIKGFMAVIVPFVAFGLLSLWQNRVQWLKAFGFGRGIGIMLLIISPWFIYMVMRHGQTYLNYMLIDETKNRLVNGENSSVLSVIAATFVDHSLFYIGVLGTYFAPWCLFLVAALPLTILKIYAKNDEAKGLKLMLAWFGFVFCFFSMIYFTINHYLLVLSTPFALLVGYFLVEPLPRQKMFRVIITVLRKYLSMIIFSVGISGFAFLFVFLAKASTWWLVVFAGLYFMIMRGMWISQKPITAPLCLGLLLVFIYAQASVMDRAGITSHSVLQKFAGTIQQESELNQGGDEKIGVGSHDIHEKEFQVYFDQRVIKAAGSEEEETRARLRELFNTDDKVYCLMTERDYNRFVKGSPLGQFTVIQDDYTFRRRMSLDRDFLLSVMRLDHEKVRHYLKEKIVLVRKEQNV